MKLRNVFDEVARKKFAEELSRVICGSDMSVDEVNTLRETFLPRREIDVRGEVSRECYEWLHEKAKASIRLSFSDVCMGVLEEHYALSQETAKLCAASKKPRVHYAKKSSAGETVREMARAAGKKGIWHQDIAKKLDITPHACAKLVNQLQADGVIERAGNSGKVYLPGFYKPKKKSKPTETAIGERMVAIRKIMPFKELTRKEIENEIIEKHGITRYSNAIQVAVDRMVQDNELELYVPEGKRQAVYRSTRAMTSFVQTPAEPDIRSFLSLRL